jgi:hypothetical protein
MGVSPELKLKIPAWVFCMSWCPDFEFRGTQGYGLLQADLIEEYLLQYFALSAHGYSRGTWIAPESTPIDRNVGSPSFATPAGMTAPILLKWLLVYEEPIEHTVWFAKAVPRCWLQGGERIAVRGAGTAYGRVSMELVSGAGRITANLTVPASWATEAGGPAGGLRLRLREASKKPIASVTVGGIAWASVNKTAETVDVSAAQLKTAGMIGKLQIIVIHF